MNWIKNFILKLLRIEPAKDRTIKIKEPLSFRTTVLRNKILYRGDPAELEQFFQAIAMWDVDKTRFWASISQGAVRKIHSGIVGIVIDRYKDMLMSDMDGITVAAGTTGGEKQLQETWDKIEKDNDFLTTIGEAIAGALSSGDGAFKISIDPEEQYPSIEFYDAEDVDFIRVHGRLKEIKYYTTYQAGEKEFRLEETYGAGYVKYILYDDAAKSVDLNTLPETKDLQDVEYDGEFIMGIPFMIFSSNRYRGRGKALFDGKTDVIDALDEVISQWLDAVRLGRIKRYIPESLIPRDPNTGQLMPANPFDNDFMAIASEMTEGAAQQITVSQPQISYEAYVNSYISFLDMVLQGIMSPSTLGIDLKKTDNADSQREKEKVTLYVRSKIVDALTEVLPLIVSTIMRVFDVMQSRTPGEYDVSIKFGEYASPDFGTTVDTIGKAKAAGVMSIETAVEQMYGDTWTDEEKAEEVARLKEEAGITTLAEPIVPGTDILQQSQNMNQDQNTK